MQKQVSSWGIAFVLTALFLGLLHLLIKGVESLLNLFLKENTPEQNKAYATAVVGIPLLILVLVELYRL